MYSYDESLLSTIVESYKKRSWYYRDAVCTQAADWTFYGFISKKFDLTMPHTREIYVVDLSVLKRQVCV
jgi:hypothetical protein